MPDSLIYTTKNDNGVAEIVLNNPRHKNAMTLEMMKELCDAILDVQDDDAVHCIIIRGEGGTFCSGGDLSSSAGGSKKTVEESRDSIAVFGRAVQYIQQCEKPFIAMVDGYAIGGGLSLALACDMVYAADTAKMSSNFLHVSLAPEMGSMVFLCQSIGVYKAKELWYSGRRVTGEEGYQLGFVSKCIPADELYQTTLDDAAQIPSLPRTPTRIMKRIVNTHVLDQVPAVLAADVQDSPLCFLSDEDLQYLAANFMKKK
ncbi:MAG: enoyl-CoA hydratase/isomerase family protein [Eggerthellaceae bacterium]|nr:enoyl-CoA hydratase/isomerase family protein [Eggerthellaceae bacterium]